MAEGKSTPENPVSAEAATQAQRESQVNKPVIEEVTIAGSNFVRLKVNGKDIGCEFDKGGAKGSYYLPPGEQRRGYLEVPKGITIDFIVKQNHALDGDNVYRYVVIGGKDTRLNVTDLHSLGILLGGINILTPEFDGLRLEVSETTGHEGQAAIYNHSNQTAQWMSTKKLENYLKTRKETIEEMQRKESAANPPGPTKTLETAEADAPIAATPPVPEITSEVTAAKPAPEGTITPSILEAKEETALRQTFKDHLSPIGKRESKKNHEKISLLLRDDNKRRIFTSEWARAIQSAKKADQLEEILKWGQIPHGYLALNQELTDKLMQIKPTEKRENWLNSKYRLHYPSQQLPEYDIVRQALARKLQQNPKFLSDTMRLVTMALISFEIARNVPNDQLIAGLLQQYNQPQSTPAVPPKA